MQIFISTILPLAAVAIVSTDAKIPREMMSLVNTKADPCHDFYEYSCGGWMKDNRLHPSDTYLRSFRMVIDTNNEKIFKKIVKKKHSLLGELWNSCRALGKKSADPSSKPLLKDLIRIANAKTHADIMELAGEFSRTGNNAFIKFTVGPDTNDATTNTLYMSPADLTIPSTSYYYGISFLQIERKYRAYINELMKLSVSSFPVLHRDGSVANIVIRIERKLVSINSKRIDKTEHLSVTEAANNWPITVGAFSNGLGLLEKTTVKEDFTIHIESSDYLASVEDLITSTSVDDLKVYLAFVMVHSRVQWLGKDYYQIWFKFFVQTMQGEREPPSRDVFCMDSLIEHMPDLFGKYFYEKAFDIKREQNALEMVALIKEAMREHISRSSWLNADEKNKAYIKLNKVIALIGQSKVPNSYPSILSRDDYPANIYSILSHSFDAEMNKVGQPVKRMEWSVSSASVDARYSPTKNRMTFPAAILQPPLFNGPNVHPARNFGGIGTIMGHELTHGFDNNGRLFDGDGNKRSWWTESTAKEFESRANCMNNDDFAKVINCKANAPMNPIQKCQVW